MNLLFQTELSQITQTRLKFNLYPNLRSSGLTLRRSWLSTDLGPPLYVNLLRPRHLTLTWSLSLASASHQLCQLGLHSALQAVNIPCLIILRPLLLGPALSQFSLPLLTNKIYILWGQANFLMPKTSCYLTDLHSLTCLGGPDPTLASRLVTQVVPSTSLIVSVLIHL